MENNNKIQLTEKIIQDSLKRFLSQPRFRINNLYVFNWESDILFLTNSGYWYEIEVKISKSDFKADFKHKKSKHELVLLSKENTNKPNYFYYAVPKDLIPLEDIPEYAGLIYVDENGSHEIIKKAPILHKVKNDPNKMNLLDKFYNNFMNAKYNAFISDRDYREVKERHRKLFEEADKIKQENINLGKKYVINKAELAFMNTCEHFTSNWTGTTCSLSGEKTRGSECVGNCDRIKKFLEIIDKC